MDYLFRYEKDLVGCFRELYFVKNTSLIINEMSIRWGNIDLVEINSVALPFTKIQCEVLSKPTCAKIFVKLKNKRPLSKQKLFAGLGVSESTFQSAISELLREELIVREKQNFHRKVDFVFPKVVISGYEAKLKDYNKALFQAKLNKKYVDYSYMVFPMDMAKCIESKYKEQIRDCELGLIGVSKEKIKVYIKPQKSAPMKDYIRLMNLVISSNMYREEAAIV